VRTHGRRLADTEEALATQEQQILERETASLKRERGYIGQRMAMAETARQLADRAARLHQRALAMGEQGRSISRLTLPRPDRLAEDEAHDYTELEVVPDLRSGAVRAREAAVRARLETLTARLHTIDREERALQYRTELYELRAQELDRLEGVLKRMERGADYDEAMRATEQEPDTAVFRSSGEVPAPEPEPVGTRPPPPPPRQPSLVPTGPTAARTKTEDRRREPRFGLKVYVGVESEHNFYTGFSRNISTGGLFIATHEALDIGQEVELLFTMPSGDVVHTPGRVAWVRQYKPDKPEEFPGMGVRFVDLTPDDAEQIRYFLEEREPILYQD